MNGQHDQLILLLFFFVIVVGVDRLNIHLDKPECEKVRADGKYI
jgi:hypothetical protein